MKCTNCGVEADLVCYRCACPADLESAVVEAAIAWREKEIRDMRGVIVSPPETQAVRDAVDALVKARGGEQK